MVNCWLTWSSGVDLTSTHTAPVELALVVGARNIFGFFACSLIKRPNPYLRIDVNQCNYHGKYQRWEHHAHQSRADFISLTISCVRQHTPFLGWFLSKPTAKLKLTTWVATFKILIVDSLLRIAKLSIPLIVTTTTFPSASATKIVKVLGNEYNFC